MNRLLEMTKEASTWRGIITILAGFGVVLTPEQANAIIAAALGAVGLINVFRKEVKPNATVNTPPAG